MGVLISADVDVLSISSLQAVRPNIDETEHRPIYNRCFCILYIIIGSYLSCNEGDYALVLEADIHT